MLPFFLFFGMFWNVLEWWLNPSNVPMKAPASEGPYSHKRFIYLTCIVTQKNIENETPLKSMNQGYPEDHYLLGATFITLRVPNKSLIKSLSLSP